jgi:hypothetical protein
LIDGEAKFGDSKVGFDGAEMGIDCEANTRFATGAVLTAHEDFELCTCLFRVDGDFERMCSGSGTGGNEDVDKSEQCPILDRNSVERLDDAIIDGDFDGMGDILNGSETAPNGKSYSCWIDNPSVLNKVPTGAFLEIPLSVSQIRG